MAQDTHVKFLIKADTRAFIRAACKARRWFMFKSFGMKMFFRGGYWWSWIQTIRTYFKTGG